MKRSLTGKIAALPNDIREQLNRRLHDGQTAPLILPWLNALVPVQKILAAQFAGKPVNSQNLCNWRASGYQYWLETQSPVPHAKQNLAGARRFAQAARGIAGGAAAFAADHLFQSLSGNPSLSTRDLLKIFPPLAALVKADQNHRKLNLARRKARQKEALLKITRAKHQYDTAAIVLRSLHDERIHVLAAAPVSLEEKVQLIGLQLFGRHWEPALNSNQLESREINRFGPKN
jgi:hypothetical protein